MTKAVSTLPFVGTSDPAQFIAAINVDTSVDTDWTFNLQNAAYNGDTPLAPGFAMVDNMANNGIVSIAFGPYDLDIPQYVRKTFAIPQGATQCEIRASVGTVPVYFTTKTPGIPDDVNQYAVNSALAPKALWTPKAIIANTAQSANDLNCYLEFSSANQITYSLVQGSTLTDGFYNPRLINLGSASVVVLPQGADTINGGQFSNASPLVLWPNSSVDLFWDGSSFQCHGDLRFESGETPLATLNASNHATLGSHYFNSNPDAVTLFLRCKVAEKAYSVGQEVQLGYSGGSGSGVSFDGIVPSWDGTNLYATLGGGPALPNFTAGGSGAGLTNANWAVVARALKRI